MKVIDINTVAAKTSLAVQTIRNWVCLGKFPKPFKLGSRAVWDESDIDAWLEEQKRRTGGEHETDGSARC